MKSARRTYIYKLTSDRGGAPCAPDPGEHGEPLLTLSICKPAIRRTASPGDRLLGLTSHALASTDEYPLNAVIYAAIVGEAIDARDYYEPASVFQHRPDCIYRFHAANGRMQHGGRNGRTLLSHDFRYFGSSAIPIPPRLGELRQLAETLGQGHRVVHSEALERELDALFRLLWKLPTRHTPAIVTDEAYGHTPRAKTKARRTSVKPCF
jgi:hypothetical protein